MVCDLLIYAEEIGELGDDAAGEGDVSGFYVNACGFREGFDDGEEAEGGEGWGFVGFGVDDGIGHNSKYLNGG